jgi:hypothetical protein
MPVSRGAGIEFQYYLRILGAVLVQLEFTQ